MSRLFCTFVVQKETIYNKLSALPKHGKSANTMYIRIKYKSAKAAEDAGLKLPLSCDWRIVKDRTTDAYLEVPESYEDYILTYLNPKNY